MSSDALLPSAGQLPPSANPGGKTVARGTTEIRIGYSLLATFFIALLGWAALAPLDAAVVAPGVVIVAGNRQAVQHRDGGVVGSLAVVEGQRVEQGQVLLELSSPELLSQEGALLSQIVELQMQGARLAAEISGADVVRRPAEWASWSPEDLAVAEQALRRHSQKGSIDPGGGFWWSEFDARIFGYREEISSVEKQERLLIEELAGMRELLERQLVPLPRVRALERALAALQGRRAELGSLIATAQQQRSDRKRDTDARLAELLPKFAGIREQLERTKVRAPSTGTVVGLSAHTVGGVISPGQQIMDIVPEGRELIVEAHVRPEDADNLFPGQAAQVRITAFTGRDLPLLDGEVRSVSADRFTNGQTGQAFFKAEIRVPAKEIARLAEDYGSKLRPGLPANIVAPTRKRTALQYLLEPLDQTLWRSFRED